LKHAAITGLLFLPVFIIAMNFPPASDKQPVEISQKQPPAGEKVFKKYCVTCHQADAGGVPNLNPPLIKTEYVLGDKERLIKIILHGLNEKLEIEGQYYSNPMPALGILKDQQIADVLTYVRSNFGNNASAITAAEVKQVRKGGKLKS
jgi:mono/diheme cytochrome c family protein